jgi:hypothetical protein
MYCKTGFFGVQAPGQLSYQNLQEAALEIVKYLYNFKP